MPPSYHLKFELYPTPDPTDTTASNDERVWQPGPGASIFDDLPWHHSQADEAADETDSLDGTAAATGIECGPGAAARDWRFGRVRIASFDMSASTTVAEQGVDSHGKAVQSTHQSAPSAMPAASLGPMLGGAGQATRARYNPLTATKTTDAGWGIVHLYREGGNSTLSNNNNNSNSSENGSDGTILCIPAVPSYLTPRDFLGFVGETWRDDVSHYRMVMTSRTNRYMVLLKFRDAARAREWRAAFDGRVFNSMEAEICHVAYIKSIGLETPGQHRRISGGGSIGSIDTTGTGAGASSGSSSLRPFPPPTPSLIELPTCPVCLERMDDTAGLMTILCQHVFHCTCLQTWKGSGCPVCRATNPLPMAEGSGGGTGAGSGASGGDTAASSSAVPYDPSNPYARPFGAGISNLCEVCDCADDLWICLICGNVGCGRYKRGHAKDHWKETAHSFSLELETQYVWDYAGDMWVHRLIRDKGDGKVVELPGQRPSRQQYRGVGRPSRPRREEDEEEEEEEEEEDVVPRAKLDRIGLEYTHLLTSQLESQRVYFEEMVNKAADKAAKAAGAAEAASAQTAEAMRELRALREAHETLAGTTVPALERDVERERRRADKAAELARGLGRSLQEEKKVSEGLMARIRHMQEQVTQAQAQAQAAQEAQAELEETNRDLTMFISGQEKLRELEAEGAVEAGEVEEGTVSVAEEKKGKGKGKGRRR